ncbi:MAG TPA: hypothetical protein VGJ87_24460 [Roseiflexaceae bacterium]|jgi:hypothetical protein
MSRTTRLLLTLAVALVALCATFGSAAAAPRTADTTPPPGNTSLERAYQAEKQHLRMMEGQFHQARAFADEVAALIQRLKEHGGDTMPLERALATFRDRMGAAHRQWEAARDILATHAGFDDEGHVTNADRARATVRNAHAHLMRADRIIRAAFHDLRTAAAAFLEPHH